MRKARLKSAFLYCWNPLDTSSTCVNLLLLPHYRRGDFRMADVLVTPAYVRTMARYNRLMNERLYEAAARTPDGERRKDQGAFWGSLFGTLNHLLWGDRVW